MIYKINYHLSFLLLIRFCHLLIYVFFFFFRKMASKNISLNLSGEKTLKGGSSKNIGERTPPELMATNLSSASNDKKMFSHWKKSKEVKLPSRICYVKERESQNVNIYLYIDIPNDNGIFEVIGRVIDMCLVLDTEVVYILTKASKSHEMIKYRLSYSLYDTREVSTKLCKQIVNEMKQNNVSIVIYILF